MTRNRKPGTHYKSVAKHIPTDYYETGLHSATRQAEELKLTYGMLQFHKLNGTLNDYIKRQQQF